MAEYNLPEEYYQANGYTKLSAGSGPHLGADANLSFDDVRGCHCEPPKEAWQSVVA